MRVWIQLFFVVFFLVVGLVLMNVVVAILLDEFLGTIAAEKADVRRVARLEQEYQANLHRIEEMWLLDPLLAGLVTFTTEGDLKTKIATIYEMMDDDNNGSLSLEELNRGLKKFDFGSYVHVHVSQKDFEMLAAEGKYLNANMEMGPRGFELMIMTQLKLYTNRRLVSVMKELDSDTDSDKASESVIVLALKMMLHNLYELRDSVDHLEKYICPLGGNKAAMDNKTKMEVILSFKNLSLRRAFNTWAANVAPSMSDREFFKARMDKLEAKLDGMRFRAVRPRRACRVACQKRAGKPANDESAKARATGNPKDAARTRTAGSGLRVRFSPRRKTQIQEEDSDSGSESDEEDEEQGEDSDGSGEEEEEEEEEGEELDSGRGGGRGGGAGHLSKNVAT